MNFRKLLLIVLVLFFCSSSPTGPSIDPARKIAYVARNQIGYNEEGRPIISAEIFLVNSDGSENLQLTDTGWNEHPQFSPDGSRIVFLSDRDGNLEIYVMNINGTNQTRLTNSEEKETAPRWSPDGSKIAFQREVPEWQLFIMDVNGSNAFQVTEDFQPSIVYNWSHDGTQIVFTGIRGVEIYTVNTDGSNSTRLTFSNSHDVDPSFSPDDSKIVWSNNANISIMNSDGTDQKTLTAERDFDGNPSFSPDGNRIMYWSVRGSGVYLIDLDGSNEKLLFSLYTGSNQHDLKLTPDGNSVVYVSHNPNPYGLKIIDVDGSQSRIIATGENGAIGWTFSLSPIW